MSIHPPFEAFYIEAMLWHTTSAGRSIEDLSQWLQYVRDDDERALNLPKAALFERLQNILHQAGCLSRYLFPSRKQDIHTARAALLRESFDVADDNVLADRSLRDALEHFDERLDIYLTRNIVGQIIPDYVGYEFPQSEVPLHIFKGFFVNNMNFVLLGVSYQMHPIIEEMVRLNDVLAGACEQGHRLPRKV